MIIYTLVKLLYEFMINEVYCILIRHLYSIYINVNYAFIFLYSQLIFSVNQ